jgi:predicted transcriptional regulator
MRSRSEFIAWAALAVTLALLMNQAPSLMSYSGPPSLGSDSSDNGATTDLSTTEAYTDFSGIPMGLILLSSEYLRKARESTADVLIFPQPPIAEPASRRDQLTIMVDILDFAQKPVSRKQIIRSLNMSQHQLKKYLRFLIKKGFLDEEEGQLRTYKVTEKGSEFVRLLEC